MGASFRRVAMVGAPVLALWCGHDRTRHARLQAGVQGGLRPRVGPEFGQIIDRVDGLDMRPQNDVAGLEVKECMTGCYHQAYPEACTNTVRKHLFYVSVFALQWLASS